MHEVRHDAVKPAPSTRRDSTPCSKAKASMSSLRPPSTMCNYLLGGYRFFFFDYMDAIGVSRYVPVVVYQKGRPDNAAYIGYTLERYEEQIGKFWPPVVETTAGDSAGAVQRAVSISRGLPGRSARSALRYPSCLGTRPSCCRTDSAIASLSTPLFRWSGCARERLEPSSRSSARPPSVSWHRCSLCLTGVRPARLKTSSLIGCGERRSGRA